MKYRIIIGIITLVGLHMSLSGTVLADSLQVNVFNDNGTIRFDNEKDPVEFLKGTDVVRSKLDVVDTETQIVLISSNPNVPSIPISVPDQNGAYSVQTPWYPHLVSLEIRKGDQTIEEASLEEFNTCNSNGLCEFEGGENESTCLADCVGADTNYSPETQRVLAAQNGVIRDEAGTVLIEARDTSTSTDTSSEQEQESLDGGNFLPLLVGIILIGGAIGYWVYIQVRKR